MVPVWKGSTRQGPNKMKNLNEPVLVHTCPIFSHNFILFYEENWKVWPDTQADFLLGRALALDQGFSFGLKGFF